MIFFRPISLYHCITKSISFTLRIVLVVYTLFSSNWINAQINYPFSALTVEDGLSFRSVTAITQDTKGFLWIATTKGLNRYDGYRFLHFNKEKSADFPFPADDILDHCLHLVNDSTLWLVGDLKLYAINLNTYQYELINTIPGDVWQFTPGKDNSYWFMAITDNEHQLWHYKPTNGFKKIATTPKSRREFSSLQVDTNGHVWWSTISKGLLCYNESGKLLHQKKLDQHNWFGTIMYDTYIHIDSQNRIFVFPRSLNEIWQYFPEQDSVTIISQKLSDIIYCAYEDQQGNNWFATKNDLIQLDRKGRIQTFSNSLKRVLDFAGIATFFQDRADVLWVGTTGGLLQIPQTKRLFNNYFVDDQLGHGNSLRDITAGEKGELYFYCEIGNWGLWHLDLADGNVSKVKLKGDSIYIKENLDQAKHFIYDKERICLWAFTEHLLRIDLTDSPTLNIIENKGKQVYPAGPKVLHQLSDGNLFLAESLDNMMIYNPATDIWRGLPNPLKAKSSTSIIQCVIQDKNTLWVGTREQGLFHINLAGEMLAYYHTDAPPALEHNNILSIHVDAGAKKVWMGTFGAGLQMLDLANQEVIFYNQDDGLADNNVVSVIPSNDKLWLATYNGLSAFDYSNESFQNFYIEDGLSNNEFNYTSEALGKDGSIYLGGLNGINSFHPDTLLQPQLSLPLQLVGFQKFDHQDDSLYQYRLPIHSLDTPLVISSSISYFQFDWSLPDYVKPEKNQYFTWMEGVDNDWVFNGHQPFIRFNGLAAGSYTLKIKGCDNQGNWSVNELSIPIRVLAPIYQRWWFITLVVLSLLGLVYTITRYRYRQHLVMEKIRTRIASDLHDQVGSMLSGLAMQAEMIELQPEEANADTYAYMKNISRQAVSKMRDLVWSIDSRRDYMHHLLDRMREHADEVLSIINIDFQMESTDLPLQQKLAVDKRQHLYLIFREAITNCCKHSNADHVYIFFGRRDGKLELRIHDNGTQQLTKDYLSTGLGMDNMRARAKALKGQLTIDNSKGFLVLLRI